MDIKRNNWKRAKQHNEYRDGYYDNPGYSSISYWEGPVVRYPSSQPDQFTRLPPAGVFPSGSSYGSEESSVSPDRSKKRYILTAVIAGATVVVAAIVTAVVVATVLSDSDKQDGFITYEKTVRKGLEGKVKMTTKTWSDSLNDKNSTEYKIVEDDFKAKMDEKFRENEDYKETIVTDMQEGSVDIIFTIMFELKVTVTVRADAATTTTTTSAPDDYDSLLDDTNNELFAAISVDLVMNVFKNDPEFAEPVVSDVNECDSSPCFNEATCINGIGDFTCICMPGYTGPTCDIEIDECVPNPCQNGGYCTDQFNSYRCDCVAGTEGTNCEININDCEPNPCVNAVSCTDGVNEYTCTCEAGWDGKNCDNNINDCEPNPCVNAVSCTDGVDEYTCTCEAGWDGKNCDNNINDCEPDPCVNAVSCTDGVDEYTCTCEAGWDGKNCDNNINDCEPNPCVNAVSCTDGVDEYTCTCEAGWDGKNCDNNINDCKSNPCVNAVSCTDGLNEYTCTCEAGWDGKNCDNNINDCEPNPCVNAVSCTDGVDQYTCICEAGWDGKNCDNNINDCEPDPCVNAVSCTDGVDDYTCTCEAGWDGKNCDNNINDCEPDPCVNAVSCTDGVDEYTCTCEAGWDGKTCDNNINDCESDPCVNAVSCTDGLNVYTCTCEVGWDGKNCDNNINDCEPNPCVNAVSCTDGVDEYMCTCEAGWDGKNCDNNINDCEPTPCVNAVSCTDGVDEYMCTCEAGWDGKNCDNNIDECEDNPCEHGTCTDGIGTFSCSCDAGWTGGLCDVDIDECEATPCQNNAECSNENGSFSCTCTPGWSGDVCDTNVNECQMDRNPCGVHGTCIDNEGSYKCNCSDGWQGQQCEEAIPIPTTTTSTSSSTKSTTPVTTSRSTSASTTSTTTSSSTSTSTSRTPSTSTTTSTSTSTTQSPSTSTSTSRTPSTSTTTSTSTSTTQSPSTSTSTSRTPSTSTTTSTSTSTTQSPSTSTSTSTTQTLSTSATSTKSTTTKRTTAKTREPNPEPTSEPEPEPTGEPGPEPTSDPGRPEPTVEPRPEPTGEPEPEPTGEPGPEPTGEPGPEPTGEPGPEPTGEPGPEPTGEPGPEPTGEPGPEPTGEPGPEPTRVPYHTTTTRVPSPIYCPEERCEDGQCYNSNMTCDGHNDCVDGTDESDCSYEFEIRLMDRNNETTDLLFGRIEVRMIVNSQPVTAFGTICDDSWDEREAAVVCRSLGASDNEPSYAYGNAAFGQGAGPIWLSNFHCSGDENSLDECSSSVFGNTHCSHGHDAAISCGIDRRTTVPRPTFTTVPTWFTTETSTYSTTSPISGLSIRLVDGDDCLQGRVEVYYQYQWRSVCSLNFDTYEARQVCRSLGYGDWTRYYRYGDFGVGSGYFIYLDCGYYDTTLSDCTMYTLSYCSYYDAGVSCSGDPDTDCEVPIGIPDVNCTFNVNPCAYNRSVESGEENWQWKSASSVGMTDSQNSTNGKIMIFGRNGGNEMDAAKLESPPFTPTASNMKVEFYYHLHESSYRNLIVSLNTSMGDETIEPESAVDGPERELWGSEYLLRDKEDNWLYQCVELNNLDISSNYTMVFTAMKGPDRSSTVAVDHVNVTEGFCAKNLLDSACDFNRTSSCGMTVECAHTCDRTKLYYTWAWKNGTFMEALSANGIEGDKAVLSFSIPSFENRTTLKFMYHMFGVNGGSLEVQLFEGEIFHSSLSYISGAYGNNWRLKCVSLPSSVNSSEGLHIKFKAIRGRNISANIAVDTISLEAGECQDAAVNCSDPMELCGWSTDANKNLTWVFVEDGDSFGSSSNIRLVDGPTPNTGTIEIYYGGIWGRVCDDSFDTNDAKVVCRMLGYPTDIVDYHRNSFYGRGDHKIWLDDLYCTGTEESLADCRHNGWGNHNCAVSEYASVTCYGSTVPQSGSFAADFFTLNDYNADAGEWASITSPEFDMKAGVKKITFNYQKTSEGILQIWYYDRIMNQTEILDRITEPAEDDLYCLTIPETINGQISIGVTAYKISASNDSVGAAIRDLTLLDGSCGENLAQRSYTFESDHRLYLYKVYNIKSKDCEPWNGWTRESASTIYNIKADKTFSNESGHFMFYDGPPSQSELRLGTIPASDSSGLCSLRFHYFTIDQSPENGLYVFVNGKNDQLDLSRIPLVTAWFPACIPLVDQCDDEPGMLDITFTSNIEVGLDDIFLSQEPCPDPEMSSVTCVFLNGIKCGYFFDANGWEWSPGGSLISIGVRKSYLVSPMFNVSAPECVLLVYEGGDQITKIQLIDSLGNTVASNLSLTYDSEGEKNISLDLQPGTDLRLYIETYSFGYFPANRTVKYIDVLNHACDVSTTSSNDTVDTSCETLECEGRCLPRSWICDGAKDCPDGSDEICECGYSTFNCTLFDECIHMTYMCDGSNDCTDGSDELDCDPSVNCSFMNNFTWTCGYSLSNAVKAPNTYGLTMQTRLAYIITPPVNLTTDSCLEIIAETYGAYFRIATIKSETYSVVFQDGVGDYSFRLLVDIDDGDYDGIVIETSTYRSYYPFWNLKIAAIAIYGSLCTDIQNNTSWQTLLSTTSAWTTFPTTPTSRGWPTTHDWFTGNYTKIQLQTTNSTKPWYYTTRAAPSTTPRWYNATTMLTTARSTFPTTPRSRGWPTTHDWFTDNYTKIQLQTTNSTKPWYYTTRAAPSTTPRWYNATTMLTTGPTPPTTTGTPLPDDYPVLQVHDPDNTTIGGSVTLSCVVTHDVKYQLIMYWTILSGTEITVSRDADIMVPGEQAARYEVLKRQESGMTIYNLTIHQVASSDISPTFQCVADVLGYRPWAWLRGATQLTIQDDGCIAFDSINDDERICPGYDRIIRPRDDLITFLRGLAYDFLYSFDYGNTGQCVEPMHKLACGVHISHCQSGQAVRPMCREHCQEIAGLCMNYRYPIVLNNNTDLMYHCNYFPSMKDRPDCEEIWMGCDFNITLGNGGTPSSIRLRSENYPSRAPSSSPCSYTVYAMPLYLLNVTVIDISLRDDCTANYLMVNGERYCSNNASLVERVWTDGVFNVTLVNNESELETGVTNESELETGFLLSITQDLPETVCFTAEVKPYTEMVLFFNSTIIMDPCFEWILITPGAGYSVLMNFTYINGGCLYLTGKDVNHTVCNSSTQLQFDEVDFVKLTSPGHQARFSVNITSFRYIKTNPYGFEIKSIELRGGYTEASGRVYITREDGMSGYMCGYFYSGAADVICKEAGFGPAMSRNVYIPSDSSDLSDILLFQLGCSGYEDSIVQCDTQRWIDTCDTGCDCYYSYIIYGITCSQPSVSCYMPSTYACGYEFNSSNVLHAFTERFGDGLYINPMEPKTARITSPTFTYSQDETVLFEYSFDGNHGDTLELFLQMTDGSDLVSIWKTGDYILNGRLQACLLLPVEFKDIDVQLVFEMSISGTNHTVGLNLVIVDSAPCPEKFPMNSCSFHNEEVCSVFYSQTCHGKNVWQIKDAVLRGDSTYAEQDVDYPMTFEVETSIGTYLRFKYFQTGSGKGGNDFEFKIIIDSTREGSEIVYTDNQYRPGFENICVNLPSIEDETFNVTLMVTKHNSEGVVYLDDILIDNTGCPHPSSCDFDSGLCGYSVTNSTRGLLTWSRYSVYPDHTSGSNGYVMRLSDLMYSSQSDLTEIAIFATPVVDIGGERQYRCLSFFHKLTYYGDTQYRFVVEIFYPDTTSTVLHAVSLDLPYVWREEQINIDTENNKRAQISFMVTKLHGRTEYTPLHVDDIALLPTKCSEGLQDIDECNFNHESLCAFETNCTVGSGFIWTVHSYTMGNTGLVKDADGSISGGYLYLDSSLGHIGHESFVWFHVDLSGTHSKMYKFKYQNNGSSTLQTFYRDAATNMYSEKRLVQRINSAEWLESDCYVLPDGFRGEIYFLGVRGESALGDIALDNVQIPDGICKDPSVACDFLNSQCGYRSTSGWILGDGYMTTNITAMLLMPVHTLNEDTCITFEFEGPMTKTFLIEVDAVTGMESKKFTVFKEGTNKGHINYRETDRGMWFSTNSSFPLRINRVMTTPGVCLELTCEDSDITCNNQCLPDTLLCDRNWDCDDGFDERDCGYSIECDFMDNDDCGYSTDFGTEWTVTDSYTFSLDNEEHTVSRWMLYTSLANIRYGSSSLSSTWQEIDETRCLRFEYLGTCTNLIVNVDHNISNSEWADIHANMTPSVWRPAQMTVEPGKMKVSFTLRMENDPPTDPFIAISNIQLLSGDCQSLLPPDCPDEASYQCDNGSLCHDESVICDRQPYCKSGSDENEVMCGPVFTIPCDFEDEMLCGWQVESYSSTAWKRTKGYKHQLPPFDHTFNDATGHFLRSINWDNNHNTYEVDIIRSPIQTFKEDGCITFWYYLNSTAVQPNALSAQILVSLIYPDASKTDFIWYDYVDRRIDGWIQGAAPVPANTRVQMNITSIQFETFMAWPGVVALDDVAFKPGECEIAQECHERSFECKDSRVCIPIEFVCDGNKHCVDNSDEADCSSRPDDRLELAGGDGLYGQLRYFNSGTWKSVCMPYSSFSTQLITEWACRQLGYTGNSTSYVYELLDSTTESVWLECDSDASTCSMDRTCFPSSYTDHIGLKCSNSECFSGERKVPDSQPTICLPVDRFCDGSPDVEGGADENECYCMEGETRCTRTRDQCTDDSCQTCEEIGKFECLNHQCIDKSKRCDFKTDCRDGSDEYRCVRVDDQQVLIDNGTDLLPLCYNNIGRHEADMLCSLSGKGMVTSGGIQHGYDEIRGGVEITESDMEIAFLEGLQLTYRESCYPLKLVCELPECGTSVFSDQVISSFIVHGDKAVPGEWPHQGLLRKDGDFNCGCSWLGGKWVLTAAHCIEDYRWNLYQYTVMFGSTISDIDGPHGQEFTIDRVYPHPDYNEYDTTDGYDLAILKLSLEPNLDNYTRPVCLGNAERLQEIFDASDEADCFITGFGADERFHADGSNPEKDLMETKVSITSREKCEELYYNAFDETGLLSHDGLCLINDEPYQPACYGDSGGPFVCRNKQGRWEQFGVTSYGSNRCKFDVPVVYVNVTGYFGWFSSITGINFDRD